MQFSLMKDQGIYCCDTLVETRFPFSKWGKKLKLNLVSSYFFFCQLSHVSAIALNEYYYFKIFNVKKMVGEEICLHFTYFIRRILPVFQISFYNLMYYKLN